MATARGRFQAFRVDYQDGNGNSINAYAQARQILAEVQRLAVANPNIKVGITYSANHNQTNVIRQAYGDRWENRDPRLTGIEGDNQAKVIKNLETLLQVVQYQHLQKNFRILPITTMTNDGSSFDTDWINRDLQYIDDFNKQGNIVLGWQNQDTQKNLARPFAIGGGADSRISLNAKLTDADKQQIQDQLLRMQNGQDLLLRMPTPARPVLPQTPPVVPPQAAVPSETIATILAALNLPSTPQPAGGPVWQATPPQSTEFNHHTFSKPAPQDNPAGAAAYTFTVSPKDEISTRDTTLETFQAMLESFKAVYPNDVPNIKAPDRLVDLWKRALQDRGFDNAQVNNEPVTPPRSRLTPSSS